MCVCGGGGGISLDGVDSRTSLDGVDGEPVLMCVCVWGGGGVGRGG